MLKCLSIDRRYDADYVTLSKLVKNGSLGRVVEYETHFDRHRPELAASNTTWKTKGVPETGAIYDLGAHLLDQAVHLFGLPQRITGFVGSQRVNNPTGLEDSFTALLHYNTGLLVTAKAAVVSPEEKQLRFWVRGEKGSFKKFHLDIQEDQLKAGIRPGDSGYGLEPSDRYGMFLFFRKKVKEKAKKDLARSELMHVNKLGVLTTIDQNGQPSAEKVPTVEGPTWVEYYRKLARALAGESELPASGAEASQVIRLIELARESSKLGKTMDV
jgi:predicted dehydrogenase